VYRVDDAMKAGFGWEIGSFESWDCLGVAKTVAAMKAAGYQVAAWVDEMLASGATAFFKVSEGKRMYYDLATKTYQVIPGSESFLILQQHSDQLIWKTVPAKFMISEMGWQDLNGAVK